MKPVEPPISPGTQRIVFGEKQPEYISLPAAVSEEGVVMTEWELSAEDLAALVNGGRVRLWIWIHQQNCRLCSAPTPRQLQPVALEVTNGNQTE